MPAPTIAKQRKLVKALEKGLEAARLARSYVPGSFPNTVEGKTAEERGILVWRDAAELFYNNLDYERAVLEKMIK
jgi:hypothetical protein